MIELLPNEKIIMIKRRHGLVFLLEVLPVIFALAVILVVVVVIRPGVFYLFSAGLLMQILLTVLMMILVDYFLDAWIVTNERTIHAELHGLFYRTLSSITHDKIQDITVVTPGFLATFFRFGDVKIQSAAAVPQIIMKQIPNPEEVKMALFDAQRKMRGN